MGFDPTYHVNHGEGEPASTLVQDGLAATFIAPAAGGAPEVNASSSTIPLALVGSVLLLLADRRRQA